jgi:hypothetical protein
MARLAILNDVRQMADGSKVLTRAIGQRNNPKRVPQPKRMAFSDPLIGIGLHGCMPVA